MPLPILSVSQMRAWEGKTWEAGITEKSVIGRVGKAVAETALSLTDGRILLLAGKGHNGDDVRAAVSKLPGPRTRCLTIKDPEQGAQDFARALAWNPTLLVDGLFGIGLNRPLSPGWARLIEKINQSCVPILSVDLPSGLDADNGADFGAIIQAQVTLTVGAPKTGLLRRPEVVGELRVASEVGLVSSTYQTEEAWVIAEDFKNFPPLRPVVSHKGDFGHLTIIAGSEGFQGAAVLSARGAMRARPGLISLFVPAPVYSMVGAQLAAPMVHPWKGSKGLPPKTSALLFGPGMVKTSSTQRDVLLNHWRKAAFPVVVDASALEFLSAGTAETKSAIRVITPHPGEAARLLGWTIRAVQHDRLKALRQLSRLRGGCWVVLKGWQTLVGRAEGAAWVNSSGDPGLAQGGSGDLLAGFLSGLLAQPVMQKDPQRTLAYGVWEHGKAAERLSRRARSWTIEELAGELGK